MRLTIIGLGPGDPKFLTREAERLLSSGAVLVLRTRRHGVADWLADNGIAFSDCDDLYEMAQDFDALAAAIAEKVAGMMQLHDEIIYAVPGQGIMGDATVAALLAQGYTACIVPGLPDAALGCALAAGHGSMADGMAWMTALEMYETGRHGGGLRVDTMHPLLVTQLNDSMLAAQVKLCLLEYYPPEVQVTFIDGQRACGLSLEALDRQPHYDHRSMVMLPAVTFDHLQRYTVYDLQVLMERLLAPGGCEWDREQTHDSLCASMIEEAYEAVDAIERGDMTDVCEELGDVLLQVVFHACLAEAEGEFGWLDICTAICNKLVRRHPHVFGDAVAHNATETLALWEQVKAREKADDTPTLARKMGRKAGPALLQAEYAQQQARKVGFDWQDAADALAKLQEETGELADEMRGASGDNTARITDELGDVLFAAINVARLSGISAELALRQTTRRFISRFAHVEKRAMQDGGWEGKDLAALDAYGMEAKALERHI